MRKRKKQDATEEEEVNVWRGCSAVNSIDTGMMTPGKITMFGLSQMAEFDVQQL